jgi:FkbM family methyltransferase
MAELPWLVEAGTGAVDIGANKGAYTYTLARLVRPDGYVVAVEPIHELAHYLKKACRQLMLPAVVHECCLSSEDGSGQLSIPKNVDGSLLTGFARLGAGNNAPHAEIRRVRICTLDQLLQDRKQRVSFIKCDVEGHERSVFAGAKELVEKDRPSILVEIEQEHLDRPIQEVFEYFEAMRYKGFFLVDGVLHPLRLFVTSLHQAPDDIRTPQQQYVHNFLFLPEERMDSLLSKRQTMRGIRNTKIEAVLDCRPSGTTA